MEENERRIYSFNKAVFILCNVPNVNYEMKIDKDTLESYCVFENSLGVAMAIREFNNTNCVCKLHGFLNIYKKIRKESIELKNRYLKQKEKAIT
ncbi:hypothetical protein [Clostridium sp. JS66]|uniref:hypothetical protein n=1 Tax=Clostridium sp. JS66 TaxID=3064705 RepID=UPI00298EC7D2|nr:hypothetical protein [Clostridium sp. JS66]WPC42939.1 hypothetical protein Q6H37_05560 [Clostridium sp. JS66]